MMLRFKALLTLIRLPNLVFIFLTQVLAHHFLLQTQLEQVNLSPSLHQGWLILFALSTAMIAAAGYIINDYFDIGIDSVNKPERVTIVRIFKRRSIIIWHIVLNVLALLIAGFIAYQFVRMRVLGFQLISIFLLIVYSTTFKRKLIIGNLIISLLTSLTLISLAFYEPGFPLNDLSIYHTRLYWFFIAFAFLITFIREVVKDIEDIKGDGSQNCKTIPLVWGINTAKYIIFGVLFFLLLALIYLCFQLVPHHLIASICLMTLVFIPLLFVIYQLNKANTAKQFHSLSTLIKLITLAGILSMPFIV